MRFTFADLKKTISRRKGGAHLVPFLLRPGELTSQLEQLIALFDGHVGREHVYFPEDRPAELIGDYRLARCLAICLSEWYEWRSPVWPEGATDAEAAALMAAGIKSSSALRLALYDFVNETVGGFLAGHERDTALDAFAASLGLARSTLDDLLRLDADPQQVLARLTGSPPTPDQLATRYNQRAVETVLANASAVEWEIAPHRDGEPLGTLVKRACFLARQMGVQYEVTFAESVTQETSAPHSSRTSPHDPFPPREGGKGLGLVAERPVLYAIASPSPATASLDAIDRSLILTLYGPQELTGAPTQYGERLARLCRALLGYRRDASRPGRAALAGEGLRGAARIYLHGRPLTFILDDKLLRLLEPARADSPLLAREGSGVRSLDAFDSSLESRLAEEWASLARERVTAGWKLEREPEPLLAGDVILVPDFALSRGGQRIYLEIAGYWRPEYRERKVRKLTAMRETFGGDIPLILAAPEAARPELGALAGQLPVVWYREYLSAPVVLALLEREYNDFEERLAALDAGSIQAAVVTRERIPPDEAYALLRCYTRAELAATLDALRQHLGAGEEALPRWIEGIGLCSPVWHDELLASLRDALLQAPDARLSLTELAQRIAARYCEVAGAPESAWEMLARQAGLQVVRSSLFAALVTLDDAPNPTAPIPLGDTGVPSGGTNRSHKAQPHPKAKRKHSERGTSADHAMASLFETDA